jgi:hypothetical protein
MTEVERKKLVFYLDGLRYSFQMADLVFERLKQTLDQIAQSHSKNEHSEEQVTSVLLDSWTLVDICHRVRELVQQLPRLSHRLPSIQIFLRDTERVEALRHYVQHFRSGIPDIPFQSNPLWGVLSWTPTNNRSICYTILSGNLTAGTLGNSLELDTNKFEFCEEIRLTANGIAVNLLFVYQRLGKIKRGISEELDKLQNPRVKTVKGKTIVLSFEATPPSAVS